MNGVLNLSVLDGWWPEACEDGVNGWAIGDHSVDPAVQDTNDHDALCRVLVDRVLPAYTDRASWTAMMQASIATATERFSSDRMVREYFERLYAREPDVVS